MIACYYEGVGTADNLVLQKVNMDGNRLWGESGLSISQLTDKSYIECSGLEITPQGDVIVVYKYSDAATGWSIYALCISGDNGEILWDAPVKINSVAEDIKNVSTLIFGEYCVVAWMGNRSSKNEVYMQPIYYNGSYDGASVDATVADVQNTLSVTVDNNAKTRINVTKASRGNMRIGIYTVDGRLVNEISETDVPAGKYQYYMNLDGGVYIVQLICDGNTVSAKSVVY